MSKARNIADLGSNDVLDTDGTGATVSGHLTVSDSTPDFVIQDTDGTNQLMKMQQVGGASMIKFRSDTNDGELYFTGEVTGNNKMKIATNGDITMYKDDGSSTGVFFDASSGSVGVGVVPENWSSTWDSLSVGISGSLSAVASSNLPRTFVSSNCYNNGSNQSTTWKYTNTDAASQHAQINGSHEFRVASSGTADTTITWNTAAIIDNNGNLRVGTTSLPTSLISATSGGGIVLDPDSYSAWNREATFSTAAHLIFNQTGVDAQYLQFRKNGSEVGAIGVVDGDIPYFTASEGTSGLKFDGDNSRISPCNATGAILDNTTDLGNSGGRFKDLYLSGGVYLGGTGSANKLDDYESGDYQPTLSSTGGGTVSALSTLDTLSYTKVGRFVHIQGNLHNLTISGVSGDLDVTLPFVAGGGTERSDWAAGTVLITEALTTSDNFPSGALLLPYFLDGGSSYIRISGGADQLNTSNISDVRLSFQYITSA